LVNESDNMILKQRHQIPELMDDPDLDVRLHYAALRGLRRVNQISRSSDMLWASIRRLAEESPGRPLRVLDIASGGGDVVVSLSQKAHRHGFRLQIDGCDISEHAIEFASQFAEATSPARNRFFRLNALHDAIPTEYDVVMCSLFLHHLNERDAARLLSRMAGACRRVFLVNDLLRTSLGYAMAWTGCRLLTRSPIVHVDGPRSVQAAWSDNEVRNLAIGCGLDDFVFVLTRHWPQRFLLSWSKK
jgi:2-polyprenyl-3-methyl-5-hydroxy-6-metoxy-1,4-benzoquinol methylase